MPPSRMPTRQMDSSFLVPPYYDTGVIRDLAGRVSCVPVSFSDGKKPKPPCFHNEHYNNNGSSYGYSNGVVPPLLSSSPPCSIHFGEFTPPPSPFGYKSGSGSGFSTILKTPSSVRTAETESIASMSPCRTTNTITRSPLPMTNRMARRPRTPVAALAKQFHHKKKNSKQAYYYDNSNHSRHSNSSRSNCNSPSLGGLDNTDHSIHSSSQSSYAGSTQHTRRQKIKTELCQFYFANEICPYGAGCHYAHGEEELQTKGLLDLQRRGLIEDASTYRVKPCFSHVAMGSCPFGKRCACIHDPRVTGTVQSWLPITETQGNNIMTDINVEGLHQKRRFGILYGDPFVGEPRMSALVNFGGTGDRNRDGYHYGWSDLYNMVANINNNQQTSGVRGGSGNIAIHKRRYNQPVWEVHKLSIALQMHGGTHKFMYKYRPTHCIFNELCMVLDKRAFRLEGGSGKATPLLLSEYRVGNPNHCIVREIAFGPDQDPSVRPVALWFNISEDKVTECTIHRQKLFRWRKQKLQRNIDKEGHNVGFSSPFDSHDSFVMIRPIDCDAFSLVRNILGHRYATVRSERITSIRERSVALEKVAEEFALLHDRFSNLKRHWGAWTYPLASRRRPIDEHTPVPPADAKYAPTSSTSVGEASGSKALGCLNETKEMWESFLSTLEVSKNDKVDDITTATRTSYLLGDFSSVRQNPPRRKRLSVFLRLSQGGIMDTNNRSLPYIKNRYCTSTGSKPKDSYLRQSERCWKSLVLQNDRIQAGEWDIVVDHFTNSSRSQKVLNIIQK